MALFYQVEDVLDAQRLLSTSGRADRCCVVNFEGLVPVWAL